MDAYDWHWDELERDDTNDEPESSIYDDDVPRLLQYLSKRNIDVKKDNANLLYRAAGCGALKMVRYLVEQKAQINVSLLDFSALGMAIQNQQSAMVQLLLDLGALPKLHSDPEPANGHNALRPFWTSSMQLAIHCYEHFYDDPCSDESILHDAILHYRKCIPIIKSLLWHGCSLPPNTTNFRCLTLAAEVRRAKTAPFLLATRHNPQFQNPYFDPHLLSVIGAFIV